MPLQVWQVRCGSPKSPPLPSVSRGCFSPLAFLWPLSASEFAKLLSANDKLQAVFVFPGLKTLAKQHQPRLGVAGRGDSGLACVNKCINTPHPRS